MDERDKWWLQPLMSYGYLTQSSPYPLLNRMKHFYTLVCLFLLGLWSASGIQRMNVYL